MSVEETGQRRVLIEAEEDMEGERIDKLLAALLPEHSRSYLQKLIADGSVLVESKAVKPSYKISFGENIEVILPPAAQLSVEPQDIPLDILYEDEDVLVINKPKGMVVHPAPGHMTDTVVNAVLYHCKGQLSGINGVLRPGIVHRIDMDTTGSLIICKNDQAHRQLAQQLAEHSLRRAYRALVWGTFDEEEGTVDCPIGRDKKDRRKMAVLPDGKRAVTHYKVLMQFDKLAYIECRLETGRTHQIRVHMTKIGHPLLGDEVYGKRNIKEAGLLRLPDGAAGQCLHAYELGFLHPRTNEWVETCAPLPAYFEKLLEDLKRPV
ncbi:MAG: RluA family pseudouridine synthase [Lachnospiraceae bacterium]|nr:RluA family pseudouridine synthase [Lachnospiraceae bacterium]